MLCGHVSEISCASSIVKAHELGCEEFSLQKCWICMNELWYVSIPSCSVKILTHLRPFLSFFAFLIWQVSIFIASIFVESTCKKMGRESIEEGGLSNPLLLVKPSGSDGGRNVETGSSSATTMVVLSTLVAVCGSYVFGSAVSIYVCSLLVILL